MIKCLIKSSKLLTLILRYEPLIVFRRQNHTTFIFLKTMSHDLLVQMAYWTALERNAAHCVCEFPN